MEAISHLSSNESGKCQQLIRRVKIALLIFSVGIGIFCFPGKKAVDRSNSTLEPQKLLELMAGLTPEGWHLYDKVYFFTADNLFERINGRAELYLSYDVVSLTTATFERGTDIGDFIEISVYDMGNLTNAFGIFSVERPPGETPLDLVRISYRSDSSCYIWKGKYYVAVVASDNTAELRRMSLEMARKVTLPLTDSGEPIWGLTAFPSDALIPDSLKYFKVDAMGLDFMKDVYTVKYRGEQEEITAFISKKDSSQEANSTVKHYIQYCENYGGGSKRITKYGTDLFLCDMNGTFDIIFSEGCFVCGILLMTDPDEAVGSALGIWRQHFHSFK